MLYGARVNTTRHEPGESRLAWRLAILTLVTVLAYLPVFQAGFIWDDDTTLTANTITLPGGLYRTWFTTAQPNYWPFTWSLLWAQWQCWGPAPLGYHAFSLFLHLCCTVLMWRLLARLRVPGAWFAALLFAVHPVNAETVAWVTQQKTLLSVLFGALSFLLYQRYRDSNRRAVLALALASFAVALLSKSATVCLPVVLLMTDRWRQGRLTWRHVRASLPFFALSLAAGLAEIWFQYNRALAATVRADPLPVRALTAVNAAGHYLRTVLWPSNLCFVTPTPDIHLTSPAAWGVPIAALLAGVLAWRARRGWGRHGLYAMGVYGAMLLPILGFLNIYFMRYSWVADHWQYPAIIAPLAGVAALAALAARHLPRRTAILSAAAIVVGLGVQTLQHAHVHADAERLWRHTLARNPDAWIAHANLGALLVTKGRYAEAEQSLRGAIARIPTEVTPRLMLAVCLDKQGQPEAAAAELDAVLKLEPRHPQAWYERGRLQAQAGNVDAARRSYEQAAAAPGYAAPHVAMAMLARRTGETAAAEAAVTRALAIDPRDPEALHLRGDIAFEARRYGDARRDYEAICAQAPSYPGIHNDIGTAAALSGDLPAAVASFRRAVTASPDDADARNNLMRAEHDLAGDAP